MVNLKPRLSNELFPIHPTCIISEYLWVLTRNQFPSQDLINTIYRQIEGYGIRTSRLEKTDQNNCVYTSRTGQNPQLTIQFTP